MLRFIKAGERSVAQHSQVGFRQKDVFILKKALAVHFSLQSYSAE